MKKYFLGIEVVWPQNVTEGSIQRNALAIFEWNVIGYLRDGYLAVRFYNKHLYMYKQNILFSIATYRKRSCRFSFCHPIPMLVDSVYEETEIEVISDLTADFRLSFLKINYKTFDVIIARQNKPLFVILEGVLRGRKPPWWLQEAGQLSG